MKIYTGKRTSGGCVVLVARQGKGEQPKTLPPCFHIRNHSPDGFEWGYGGSGPAQLALAILCDLIGPEKATDGGLYQKFKFKVIGAIRTSTWSMTEEDVFMALNKIRSEEKK